MQGPILCQRFLHGRREGQQAEAWCVDVSADGVVAEGSCRAVGAGEVVQEEAVQLDAAQGWPSLHNVQLQVTLAGLVTFFCLNYLG